MVQGNAPALHLDAEARRALQLDALAAILPRTGATGSAELLTDEDVETLKHLAREGMGENSLGRSRRTSPIGRPGAAAAPGPAAAVAGDRGARVEIRGDHLWDPRKPEIDPRHGMPADVAETLRADGLLRPACPERRLASWSTLHR